MKKLFILFLLLGMCGIATAQKTGLGLNVTAAQVGAKMDSARVHVLRGADTTRAKVYSDAQLAAARLLDTVRVKAYADGIVAPKANTASPTFTGTVAATGRMVVTPDSMTIVAGRDTIDWSAGNYFATTLNGVDTVTFINPSNGQSILLRLTAGASDSVIWTNTITWKGGTLPTQTKSKTDFWTFIYDAVLGVYYGAASQNY